MSLPALFARPETDAEWNAWAFNHAANHFDLATAAQNLKNKPTVLVTTAATALGNATLTFTAIAPLPVINGVLIQSYISDLSTAGAIPQDTTIKGSTPTMIVMSNPAAGGGVLHGDSIEFTVTTPVNLSRFQLYPIDRNNVGYWLYNHQAMHNQLNAVLGTSGFDLLSLDWDDSDQFTLWLQQNGDEHQRISTALGVG